jgi:NADH-quinone oxidoreductase subunit C
MVAEEILNEPVARELNERIPGAIVEGKLALGELTLIIEAARIVDVCRHLKDDQKFVRLSSVTAVDWYPAEPRYEVVYHLQSIERNLRLRLKCRVGGGEGDCEIDSVTPVWRGANWYEREVFDLFGVRFRNHPDLTRILMPSDWEGHPLRKDYPVHGYKYSYRNE